MNAPSIIDGTSGRLELSAETIRWISQQSAQYIQNYYDSPEDFRKRNNILFTNKSGNFLYTIVDSRNLFAKNLLHEEHLLIISRRTSKLPKVVSLAIPLTEGEKNLLIGLKELVIGGGGKHK